MMKHAFLTFLALTLALLSGCAEDTVSRSERDPYRARPARSKHGVGDVEPAPLDGDTAGFQWQSYVSVEEAGYSPAALSAAQTYFEDLGAAAALVVVDGKILANWGDANRRFFNASVRKSFLNGLLGIAVARGEIDLDTTLGAAGIDDVQSLTVQEKTATLRNLVTARSGVYHPAAFEADAWARRRPDRGSSGPGERWFYNNWDFNVLGHVYEQATGLSIFEAFAEEIAGPLGMQDYRLLDGIYYEEPDVSRYPAYLFKTTGRDMARFGLLYLNQGVWDGERVLPARWVSRSLQPASVVFEDGTGYGYLWWHTTINGHDAFYAHGAGTQSIYLVPDYDLVYVFRDNTYDFESIAGVEERRLLSLILDAKTGEAAPDPVLVEALWPERLPGALPAHPDALRERFGEYANDRIGSITLAEEDGRVLLILKRGRFRVLQSGDHFLLEDVEVPLRFLRDVARHGEADFVAGETFTLYIE